MEIGIKGYAETMVDQSNVASSVGSGLLEVFSTPSMIALMEKAAKDSIAPYLEEGQGSVGIRLEVDHLAATPLGQRVWAETELTEIDVLRLLFIRKRKKSARAFTDAVSSAMSAFWQRSGQSTKAETHRRFGAGRQM